MDFFYDLLTPEGAMSHDRLSEASFFFFFDNETKNSVALNPAVRPASYMLNPGMVDATDRRGDAITVEPCVRAVRPSCFHRACRPAQAMRWCRCVHVAVGLGPF